MKKDTKQTLILCGAIIAVFCILIGSIYVYSGVSPPFSTINSSSMQHSDDKSHIGNIDTGDMVIVKDPNSRNIVTYVEGAKSGYSKFGEYGDVIIYKTETKNIIHRAMLHLTLTDIKKSGNTVESQTWYIPSLDGYDDWDIKKNDVSLKSHTDIWDPEEKTITLIDDHASATFELTNVGYAGLTVSISLWELGKDKSKDYSGYLTKGDNATTNQNFDQTSLSYMINTLVTSDNIKSIAVGEIPWLGCVKLLIKDTNTDQIPSNSIVSLILSFIGLLVIIFGANYLLIRRTAKKEN